MEIQKNSEELGIKLLQQAVAEDIIRKPADPTTPAEDVALRAASYCVDHLCGCKK